MTPGPQSLILQLARNGCLSHVLTCLQTSNLEASGIDHVSLVSQWRVIEHASVGIVCACSGPADLEAHHRHA